MSEKQPYRQFMYHFHFPKNSIDARYISKEDLEWCLDNMEIYAEYTADQLRLLPNFRDDCWVIKKMFKEWFPERLI